MPPMCPLSATNAYQQNDLKLSFEITTHNVLRPREMVEKTPLFSKEPEGVVELSSLMFRSAGSYFHGILLIFMSLGSRTGMK